MYGDLVGVLIEGMKELQDSLNTQAVQIAELQQQINEIKATLSGGSQPKKAPQSTANNKFKDAVLYPNRPIRSTKRPLSPTACRQMPVQQRFVFMI